MNQVVAPRWRLAVKMGLLPRDLREALEASLDQHSKSSQSANFSISENLDIDWRRIFSEKEKHEDDATD